MEVPKMTRTTRLSTVVTVTAAALAAAGCGPGLLSHGQPGPAGPQVVLTEHVAPSALVAVTSGGDANGSLFAVLAAAARPAEHLVIEQAGGAVRAPVASVAPSPATVRIPARPSPPAGAATSFQQAGYQRRLSAWEAEDEAGQHTVTTLTAQATSAWIRGQLARAAGQGTAGQGTAGQGTAGQGETGGGGPAASLTAECALAASALSGLVDQAGQRFAGRVLVLAAQSLDGVPPAGELDGDDVLVLLPFVPGAAAAAAAQQDLIAAGAARAAVLGPEATTAELAQVVAGGLSARQETETLSGPALFGNDSAVLLPAATRVLAPLIARLEEPGVTAVVNGYASAPGSAGHNQQLSQDRAAAVAGYLEAQGVSAAVLFVVGHGASNLAGAGSSGDNRRVVVVIEQPSGSA
jgi:outer membrane protein OmpA-like peptidoglycan-associated protein